MRTTSYLLGGVHSHDDVTNIRERLSDLAVAEGIGATNVERFDDRVVLNLKHRDDVTPDIGVLRRAVAAAGDFTVEPLP